MQYVETSGSHPANSLQLAFDGTTAKTGHNLTGSNKFVKFLVYSVNQTTFTILLELGTGGTPNFSMEKQVTVALNTWTEVVFDFTGNGVTVNTANYGNWNSNIRIHFNNGTSGSGDTYYVDNYVLTEANYETVANGDWGTASNWLPSNVPARTEDNIDIKHNITYTGNLSVKQMLVRVNKSLDVTGDLTVANTSNLWAGSSLKVSGTATGSFNYYRTLSTPAATGTPAIDNLEGWHLISSPVSGEQYNDSWISSQSIASGTGSNRGIATYNNAGSPGSYWSYATAPVGNTDFDEGKGYSMKRDGTGNVLFTGNIRTANITDIALTKTGANGFNLIGNPFSSYISLNDLFTANDSGGNDLLASSTIWIWNSTSKSYDAKVVEATSFQIAPGQGFFVEASAAASTFTINTSMLSNQTTDTFLKSSSTEVVLNITDGINNRYAKVNYLNNSTTGFDNGYDGKLFGGVSQPFAIYTHLVSNNDGKKYQIQSLPNSDYESMVIPVGINAASGKEITFSVEAINLPNGIKVFLEDRDNNTFTELTSSTNFKTTLNTDLNGIGRFYLHTKASVLSVDDVVLDGVSVFTTSKSNLRVTGLPQGKSNMKLYNILGKQLLNTTFTTNGVQDISLPIIAKGVYIVQLQTEVGKLNRKIILE